MGAAIAGTLGMLHTGARVFHFGLPVVDGVELDGCHDLLVLADRAVGDLGVSRISIVAVVGVLTAVGATYLLRKGALALILAWCRANPPIALIAAAFGFLLIGAGFDFIGSNTAIRFGEEVSEYVASGLVAIAAASILSMSGPTTTDPPDADPTTRPSSREAVRQRSPLRRQRSAPPVP